MALASISIDASSLARAAAALGAQSGRLEQQLDLLVRRRIAEATADFRAHTPRSVPPPWPFPAHAHMADLWQSSIFGPAAGGVFNPAAYTDFLYKGTAAHDIEPRAAGGHLHFLAGGTEVWTDHVHHPGTQPSRPLVEALHRQVDAAQTDLDVLGLHVVTDIAAQIGLP